jgi:uncharacterized protein (TIGR00251 family)
MSVHSSAYFWNGDTLVLHIFLQPRASQNEWVGRRNGRIRLRVTAALVDNQANRECMKFISKSLKTAKTNVKVVRGQTSRFKTVEIHKPDPKSWKKNLEGLDN